VSTICNGRQKRKSEVSVLMKELLSVEDKAQSKGKDHRSC
jgi:hypothetical protein